MAFWDFFKVGSSVEKYGFLVDGWRRYRMR